MKIQVSEFAAGVRDRAETKKHQIFKGFSCKFKVLELAAGVADRAKTKKYQNFKRN